MNLLFDCHTFDAGPQGTSTFLAGLLNALPAAAQRRDRPVSLLCAAQDRAAVERFVRVDHRYFPIDKGFAARNLKSLPRLTAGNVDAVVSQYVRPFWSHAPTVSVIHDVLFLDYPDLFGWRYRTSRRLLFGWAARHSDVVVTVSEYSRARIAHHFGMSPDRIDVLPNAVEVSGDPAPTRPGAAGDPVRLLYVSRFEPRKRQEWCVEAACALAAAGRRVELTLVGNANGDYAASIRSLIEARRREGLTIRIASDVSDAALSQLYRDTDLFLFPSACEGFGIPVIEGAAYSVPGVVAANTAMTELSSDYAGVATAASDSAAFSAAVGDAVGRLASLRAAAVEQAPRTRAKYRWSAVATDFLALLDRRGIGR